MQKGKGRYSSLIYLFILITLVLVGCNQTAGKNIEKDNEVPEELKIEKSTSMQLLNVNEEEKATEIENGSLLASPFFNSRLEEGFLLDSKLYLGQIVKDVKAELGHLATSLSNYIGKGADYFSDGTYAYLISQKDDKVLAIGANPRMLAYLHYDEIKGQLGESDFEGYNTEYGIYIVSYSIGNHYIHFGFDKPHTELTEIFINYMSR